MLLVSELLLGVAIIHKLYGNILGLPTYKLTLTVSNHLLMLRKLSKLVTS